MSGLDVPAEVWPVRLDFETSDPTDDIRVTFSDGRRAYVSAKRKIDRGRPLEETLTGWVRQVPTLGPDDLLVIAGEELVGPVKNLDRALRRHRAGLPMETGDESRALTLLTDRLPSRVRQVVLDRARVLHLPGSTGPAPHRDLLAALMDLVVADAQGLRAVSALADFFHRQAGEALGSSAEDWVAALTTSGVTVLPDQGGPLAMRLASRRNAVDAYYARLTAEAGRIDLSLLADDLPPLVVDDLVGGLRIDVEGERTSSFLLPYLRRWRRMLIVGQPGSGKSVAVREIAAHCASHADAPAPISVSLPRLLKKQPGRLTLDGLVDDAVADTVPDADRVPLAAHLQEEISEGRALVLCDGLDECGARAPWVAQQLEEIRMSLHPSCGFVVTTRTNAQGAAARLDLPRVELAPPKDLDTTVDSILVACAEARIPGPDQAAFLATRRAWIKDAKNEHAHLLAVPLLAALLALVCANAPDADLPKGRASLLHRAVEQSVHRWERLRGTLDPVRPWAPALTTAMLLDGFVTLGRLLDGEATPPARRALESLTEMLRDPLRWALPPAAAGEVAEHVLRFWDEHVAVFVVNGAGELTARSKVFAEIATAMWARSCAAEELQDWLRRAICHTDSDGAIALAAGLDSRTAEALLDVGQRQREATLMVADLAARGVVTLSDGELERALEQLTEGALGALAGEPVLPRGPGSPPEFLPALWDKTRDAGPWPFVEAACLLALPATLRSRRADLVELSELDDTAESIARTLCALTDARTDASPLSRAEIDALRAVLALPLPQDSEMVQKGRRRWELVGGGRLAPGLVQVALGVADRLGELPDDAGEHVFALAKYTPVYVAEKIYAALARAGFDTSRRWGNMTAQLRDWASGARDDRAALLSDLASLHGPFAESTGVDLWSLTALGNLLAATGYADSSVTEIDRAFAHDSAVERRAWLDAIADAYGIDKAAVAAQARHLQQIPTADALLDEWLVAGTPPLVKPSPIPGVEQVLTDAQQRALLACLEADSSWMAWSAANVLVNLTGDRVPWDGQELFNRDMSHWPRHRAALFYAVAVMTSGDRRTSLLTRAASSESADHRLAARMLISAVPRLDSTGSIMEALRRDADLSVRPKDAHQATPAPTHWSCNHCRTVQSLDTEDCSGCDDGVRPAGPEG
ncbi:NACHT domain-containing protein [Streptomyces sp. CL7]|uniref:NACHT domain-containing protein n=1 Tax=Streptomyces sp. CL7 TaxID=3096006 RepID=UPI002A7563B4|nr:NACHT domain-containing protein [Streptomyces sp. CL7]WPP30429.1 NACHT domain-containing protein [Streptomyces sp. CL7]